jgi:hypothetical protein
MPSYIFKRHNVKRFLMDQQVKTTRSGDSRVSRQEAAEARGDEDGE